MGRIKSLKTAERSPTMSGLVSLLLCIILLWTMHVYSTAGLGSNQTDLNITMFNKFELIQLGLSELNCAAPCANPVTITSHHGSNKT